MNNAKRDLHAKLMDADVQAEYQPQQDAIRNTMDFRLADGRLIVGPDGEQLTYRGELAEIKR